MIYRDPMNATDVRLGSFATEPFCVDSGQCPLLLFDCSLSAFSDQCTAAQKLYSITSSALASSTGGTVMLSALAVLRLMTNSNFVAC
jgi:hypothetical protein